MPNRLLNPFDLQKSQFDRGRPAEDTHHDLQPTMVLIDFIHHAVEPQEGTIDDADIVAFNKFDLLAGPRAARIDLLEQDSTSSLVSGVGMAPPPTNPVTFGVSLIICKVSSRQR